MLINSPVGNMALSIRKVPKVKRGIAKPEITVGKHVNFERHKRLH
jgi:hypothetical protein